MTTPAPDASQAGGERLADGLHLLYLDHRTLRVRAAPISRLRIHTSPL